MQETCLWNNRIRTRAESVQERVYKRECKKNKMFFFVSRKNCFPLLAAAHPEFCAYIFQPFFRQKECLKNKENKRKQYFDKWERDFFGKSNCPCAAAGGTLAQLHFKEARLVWDVLKATFSTW